MILVVLAILPYVESAIERFNRSITYNITSAFSPEQKEYFTEQFRQHKLRPRLVKAVKDSNDLVLSFDAVGSLANHNEMIRSLELNPVVRKIEHY
jgi:hypothetical protein